MNRESRRVIPCHREMLRPVLFFITATLLCLSSGGIAAAQGSTATLGGTVLDPQGAVVVNAQVSVTDPTTGQRRESTTGADGSFLVAQLAPSTYILEVEARGFARTQVSNLTLNVGDRRLIPVVLAVAGMNQTFQVTAQSDLTPGISSLIDREFVENQPLNGRSFQSLIQLSPGVVATTVTVGSQGQFSVNGQRPSTNYFTVDGVSANFGSSGAANLYEQAGGGVPMYSALGTTASLVSVDALQEFSIQTSTYAAEFGRQPGGQVSLVTRSGDNTFHGSVFEYLRNDVFDANNYFANRNGLDKPALRQNNFGFTLGGPILRDKTFFFVSYEGLRLRQPVTSSTYEVPSVEARENAPKLVRPILDAFPLPTGPALATDPNTATFVAAYSDKSSLDAIAVRVDHHLNSNWSVFGRYNYAPSANAKRADFTTPNVIADTPADTQTATAGATFIPNSQVVNDLRINYSNALQGYTSTPDDFGGAVVPPDSVLFPPFTSTDQGLSYIQLNATSALTSGFNVENTQRQWNVVNTVSVAAGAHELKFGFDYRRMFPSNQGADHRRFLLYRNVSQVLSGSVPVLLRISTNTPVLEPSFTNVSAFAQDTWRASRRLTLTYGVRYEVNPAPSERNGNLPLTVTGVSDPSTMSLAPEGTRFYETGYGNFAPRLGFSYQLLPDEPMVLRGGVGIFYDLGYTFTGAALSTANYPYGRSVLNFGVPLGAEVYNAPVEAAPIAPPYGALFAYEAGYKLPYSSQYSLSIERSFGGNLVSASYVGSAGRRLGRVERLQNPNPDFTRVSIVRNAARSDYNSLQLSYERRRSSGVQATLSYTLGKLLDTVSDESVANYQAPVDSLDPDADRGPSSFDIRHTFSAAASYDLPAPTDGAARALLRGFSIDAILRARSAAPVNVLTGTDPFGFGYTTVTRPDRILDVPLYLDDPAAAGGRRINSAAFAIPPSGRQGTAGRNIARGFAAWQLDAAVRRSFEITDTAQLQVRVEAFNLFNRPNFADPVGALNNPNFGVSTQMLGSSLGGLNGLYQIGGPRSMQLALKVLF